MQSSGGVVDEALSRLERARRLLLAQLDTLARLAAVALRLIDSVPAAAPDPSRPLSGVGNLEKAVRRYARISWALRLIAALRAKLRDDLQRVERGEIPATHEAPEPEPTDVGADASAAPLEQLRAEAEGRERLERERGESESFGRYLSGRSGEQEFARILRRPTEEVIALIREALGLGVDWEGSVQDEPPPPLPPTSGARLAVRAPTKAKPCPA